MGTRRENHRLIRLPPGNRPGFASVLSSRGTLSCHPSRLRCVRQLAASWLQLKPQPPARATVAGDQALLQRLAALVLYLAEDAGGKAALPAEGHAELDGV